MTKVRALRWLRAGKALLLFAFAWVASFAAPARAAAPSTGTKRVAILVGANAPPPGRAALRFAHDDATDLADALQRVGGFAPGDVQVLLDPAPRELFAAFDRATKTASDAHGDVLFVFYYSGHSDGQSLFPNGQATPLADLRGRLERVGARIRVGILDTCRGGSWTQAKGLTVGPPLRMADLMNVDTEGTALVSSSSGLENAHEAVEMHGSFFTHHLTAGLRGAADRAGDGNVTLEEAFDYAKERTVRDSARLAKTPQHPSFDLALRGRHDIVLTVPTTSTSALQITGVHASLEIIHLPSGVTVADAPDGKTPVRIALPPGRYLIRSVVDGRVYAREVEVRAGETATLSEGQLEATGREQLAMKGLAPPVPDAQVDIDEDDEHPPPKPVVAPTNDKTDPDKLPARWDFPSCDDSPHEGKNRISSGCIGVFGLRGSVTQADGSASTRRAGLQFSADWEEYWRRKYMSSLWGVRILLGGGGAGLEGAIGGKMAFGVRAPVTPEQGPVLRAGMQAYVFGNDEFRSTLIELPQLQAGWQWARGGAVVDFAATTGVVLTGRFRAGDADARNIAGLAYGGMVAAHVRWVRLSAMAERLPADDGLDSIDMATGTLCFVTAPLAVCGDARIQQAHARIANIEPFVRAAYGGLTLGFSAER